MKVTQRLIAARCRVSQATVSRVLGGDSRVDSATRELVLDAIKAYNYKPDERGRSLRQNRTNLVGLVVKRPPHGLQDDPFFARLIAEITEYLSESPYHLCLDVVRSSSAQVSMYDDLLRTRRIDGLIMVEPVARDPRIEKLQAEGFPFVLIGNPLSFSDVVSVDNDNVHASVIATQHLLDQGFKNVGIVAGPEGVAFSDDRIEGYKRAIARNDQAPLIWHSDFGNVEAYETGRQIFSSGSNVDGLVVLDDFMAMGVIQAARVFNIDIPDELGIVSFNDTALCQLQEYGLSSVSLSIEQMVRESCDRLLKVIESGDVEGPRRYIVPCDLKARGSSIRRREAVAR